MDVHEYRYVFLCLNSVQYNFMSVCLFAFCVQVQVFL